MKMPEMSLLTWQKNNSSRRRIFCTRDWNYVSKILEQD
jgi:hypothetical protein